RSTTSSAAPPKPAASAPRTASASRSSSRAARARPRTTAGCWSSPTTTRATRATSTSWTRATYAASPWRSSTSRTACPTASTATGWQHDPLRPERRLLGRAARDRHGPRARGRAPRLPLGVDGGGVRLGRGDAARLDRRADENDPPRQRHHADGRAHASHDRVDRDLARPALGRPLPPGARRLRPAGGRGVARAALRQAPHADARVRRDRARDLGARAPAGAPGRALPDPLSRPGRDRPREAAALDPPRAPDPHLH